MEDENSLSDKATKNSSWRQKLFAPVLGGIAILGLSYVGHILTVPIQKESQAQEQLIVQPTETLHKYYPRP